MPTPLLNDATPHEKLFGNLYDISVLRVFGCLCYISTLTSHRKKFDARAVPGIFLGLQQHTKGYQFLNLQNHKIDMSRNVMFHENCFPYTSINNSGSNSLSFPTPHNYSHNYDNINFPSNNAYVSAANETNVASDIVTSTNDTTSLTNIVDTPLTNTHTNSDSNIDEHIGTVGRSTWPERPPAYLSDFHTNHISRYPITNFLSYDKLSSDFRHTILSISSTTEPRTYKEASKIPQWTQSMQDELHALTNNNTWIITYLPPGKTAIGCRWIYKIKHKSDGFIDRFKACHVAKGYTQLEGLDYLETFASVAKLTTLCILLAIVASHHWILKQLDVNNDFLHGDLHEEVYMQIPPGFNHPNPNQIQQITTSLDSLFQIKNLGDLTYFLGIEVARNNSGIHLCQHKYTLDLLTEAGMINCAPMSTPMVHSSRLTSQVDLLNDVDASSYRRLIDRLIYLTTTRPDITFSVNNLNQFVSSPTTLHQQAAYRILRYLKGSPGNNILLQSNNNNQLKAYSDSDWATCPESRKSVTAEYRALTAVTCELQWLTYILHDLRIITTQPIIAYCDNRSAIQIASNQVFHERTKHIEIECHIVRDKLNTGLLKLLPISTTE
ncbi:hypothetical protein V8G54_036953 [Vigna mungo]|uniref:Reverse transcriptase Ty1/copia-type domain-containing protein n=1 Tax=Vigna mungo TaxID=3915 RepID=A0AAQ3MJF0_VIGMU